MKAHLKKLSGCASNLLAHEDLGHFKDSHHWNIQAKFYNEKFPLVYESDNIEDPLYEEHGATLKHKCGKKIIVPSLFFSFFYLVGFFGLYFFVWASLASFIFIKSEVSSRLVGES